MVQVDAVSLPMTRRRFTDPFGSPVHAGSTATMVGMGVTGSGVWVGDRAYNPFPNAHGTFQVPDSLFSGPVGLLKFESTWQVTDNGQRLTTTIPIGGSCRASDLVL